jgi:predicted nucleic acid-binding protein
VKLVRSKRTANELVFFDTNILVYADDRSAGTKQEHAIRLVAEHLRQGTAVVSMQVLQEYFSAATRKLGVAAEIAQQKLEILARARVVRLNESDLIAAIELHRLNHIAFWDALIVHAARSAGCALLYSGDELGGGRIGDLTVVNPFKKR